MTTIWIYTLLSVLIVSLISLLGIVIIYFKQRDLKKILLFLISFAAGAMLGDVFIHLIPELSESGNLNSLASLYILLGMIIFFVLEKIIHWRHCHLSALKDHVHTYGYMNLVGDALHNFIDGLLIAGSFLLSIPVGIATSIAVILHEIPQEMGDFGVLLHSGMKPKKALLYNFLSALSAFLGAIIILIIGANDGITQYVIPITIGGFIYIATADLIPELHKDVSIKNSLLQLVGLLLGIGVMFLILLIPFHSHDGHAHDEADLGKDLYHEDSLIEEIHEAPEGLIF